MNVSDERKYVIVCNRHKGIITNTLLFWGSLTDDNAERRSFGGYTCQIDKCERYTRNELEEWRGNNKSDYPFFDEIPLKRESSSGLLEFQKSPDVLISIDELKALGYSEMTVMTQ